MSDELTIVHVAENALIEFIEQVARGRATNISVNKADAGWTVTYKSPFVREIKKDGHPMSVVPHGCADCTSLDRCIAKSDFEYCNGKLYTKRLPLPSQQILDDIKAANKAQEIGG